MIPRRIHVLGASGAGVTTLGRAVASALAIPHHDTDDYYWLPTDPPFSAKRPIDDRLRLMREMFTDRPDWVLSGSLDGWGDPMLPAFSLVLFLTAPTALRLARLREREARALGAGAVAPGGWAHTHVAAFIDWAAHYDDSSRAGRNLARHEAWLAKLPCPLLRLDGARPLPELAGEAVAQLRRA
jgi:adenylate kinase family enzyme